MERTGSVRFGSVRFGSVRFGSLALMLAGVSGCPQGVGSTGGGGTGTDTGAGSDSGDGGDEGEAACAAIEAAVVDCNAVKDEALAADPIPVCNGGSLGPVVPPPGNDQGLAWLSPYWPAVVAETDPALVGVWSPLVANQTPTGETTVDQHLPVHSIHRPTGKFLQFGSHDDGVSGSGQRTDKVIWYPPAPCVDPFGEGVESCDVTFDAIVETEAVESHYHVNQEGGDPDLTEFNLFCAGHVNVPAVSSVELLSPYSLVVGGSSPADSNQSVPSAFVFTEDLPDLGLPASGDYAWAQLDNISYRWYPSAAVMADARVAVTGGSLNSLGSVDCRRSPEALPDFDADCVCVREPGDFFFDRGVCDTNGYCDPIAEAHEPGTSEPLGWDPCRRVGIGAVGLDLGTRTAAESYAWETIATGVHFGSYPQVFVLPDLPAFETAETHLGGKLVNVGSEVTFRPGDGARLWDPTNPDAGIEEFGGPSCTRGSSAVMFDSDRILKFGGQYSDGTTSRVSEVLDLSGPCPQWRRPEGGELGMPRHFSGGVLLPDGNVIATGGGVSAGHWGDQDLDPGEDDTNQRLYAVFTTELFDRDSETWCRLADLPGTAPDDGPTYRGYHSQSFLLPDGRVYLGAGGFRDNTTIDHYDYQLFSPPYLFAGPRPSLTPDASTTTVNEITEMITGGDEPLRFLRENTVPIERMTLVKLSAATHQFDQEQRFVELAIDSNTVEYVDVLPPSSTCYATPGYYMLFAISENGVPSIARYVSVRGTCAAAETSAAVPLYPAPETLATNDLMAGGSAGLRASCGGPGSVLGLAELGRSLLELCTAASACPDAGEIDVELRLMSSSGSVGVPPDTLLASATVAFTDGAPSLAGGAIELDVAGRDYDPAVALGPGDHLLQLCGSLAGLSACVEQPLRIDSALAGTDAQDYRAAPIELRALGLNDLAPGPGLTLGDDDVVEVPLPDGFVFPYFDLDADSIWVGANGGIRFTAGAVPASNAALPASLGPDIAVWWDDLDPSASGRVVTYHDVERFVVAWENVAIATGGTMSAQAHLFRDGRIELHYPRDPTGISGHGAGATLGIQHDGDAIALSTNDPGLLATHDAVAFDRGSCVASALRFPDSTPCVDRVPTVAAELAVCGGHRDVAPTTPAVPTVCAPHANGTVSGSVWQGGVRQNLGADGTVRVFGGDYELRWQVYDFGTGATGDVTLQAAGDVARQPLRVRFSDDANACCRDDQAVELLTSADDGPMYVCTTAACCAVGLGGNDNIVGGEWDDTLLGQADDDVIHGGAGADVVVGGAGIDWLFGGDGDDTLLGSDGDDIVVGEEGDDEIWGGAGDDYLCDFLYGGDEVILPGPGVDEVLPGPGNDHVVVLDLCEVEAGEILDGGDDDDTLWLPPGVAVIDLENLGATVSNFETVAAWSPGQWGEAECATSN